MVPEHLEDCAPAAFRTDLDRSELLQIRYSKFWFQSSPRNHHVGSVLIPAPPTTSGAMMSRHLDDNPCHNVKIVFFAVMMKEQKDLRSPQASPPRLLIRYRFLLCDQLGRSLNSRVATGRIVLSFPVLKVVPSVSFSSISHLSLCSHDCFRTDPRSGMGWECFRCLALLVPGL